MLDFHLQYMDGQTEILSDLPIGYRFLPTDEELVTHYLVNKVSYRPLPAPVAPDIDAKEFYRKPPKSLVTISTEEREWYFFIHGEFLGENIRIVGGGIGFWKSSGQKTPIHDSDGHVFAFKLQFTYYSGSISNAKKTHWNMEEYQLSDQSCSADNSKAEGWILQRLRRGTAYNYCF